jgi:hypothetical protein
MQFLCKKSGTRFARREYQIFHVGFLRGCSSSPSSHHHDNSLQDSYGTRKAFSCLPGMCIFSWIITLCSVQKDWSFLLQISPRKVHFCTHDWRCFMLALSFALQTSITMAISAYGKDCLLFYYQGVSSRNGMVTFVEMVYESKPLWSFVFDLACCSCSSDYFLVLCWHQQCMSWLLLLTTFPLLLSFLLYSHAH